MKTLFAGFKGQTNSSKLLLDVLDIPKEQKLYLTNSFQTSVRELTDELVNGNYTMALVFGQGRVPTGAVRLETVAKKGHYRRLTIFPYQKLRHNLVKQGLRVVISENAGNWLCNNVYYYGLKTVEEKGLKCQLIFVHLPKAKQIKDFAQLAKILQAALVAS